jgi:hypothetical protein
VAAQIRVLLVGRVVRLASDHRERTLRDDVCGRQHRDRDASRPRPSDQRKSRCAYAGCGAPSVPAPGLDSITPDDTCFASYRSEAPCQQVHELPQARHRRLSRAGARKELWGLVTSSTTERLQGELIDDLE